MHETPTVLALEVYMFLIRPTWYTRQRSGVVWTLDQTFFFFLVRINLSKKRTLCIWPLGNQSANATVTAYLGFSHLFPRLEATQKDCSTNFHTFQRPHDPARAAASARAPLKNGLRTAHSLSSTCLRRC